MNYTGVRLFSMNHLWVQDEEKTYHQVIGVTDYAKDQLGDITHIDFPDDMKVNRSLQQGQSVFTLESVKSVSVFESPISGVVVEVNGNVQTLPETINKSPENDGWVYKISPDNRSQTSSLMTQKQYVEYLQRL